MTDAECLAAAICSERGVQPCRRIPFAVDNSGQNPVQQIVVITMTPASAREVGAS